MRRMVLCTLDSIFGEFGHKDNANAWGKSTREKQLTQSFQSFASSLHSQSRRR